MEWQAIFGVGSTQILNRLDLRTGMRVLDVRCVSGRLSVPAARRVGSQGHVVALDPRADELRTLEERARSAGLTNIRTVHRAIEAAALDANVFGRAVLVAVLGEIRDRVTTCGDQQEVRPHRG